MKGAHSSCLRPELPARAILLLFFAAAPHYDSALAAAGPMPLAPGPHARYSHSTCVILLPSLAVLLRLLCFVYSVELCQRAAIRSQSKLLTTMMQVQTVE